MTDTKKRILTVGGTLITAAAIALSLLAFVAVNAHAATGTAMPSVSDIVPDGSMPLPGDVSLPNNITSDGTDDVMSPDSTTRAPAVTTRPAGTEGTDTTSPVTGDEGSGILGAVIAVIVVVAIILVVIALIPKKAR